MPGDERTRLGALPFQVSGYDSIGRAVTVAGRTNADHATLGIEFVAAVQFHEHRKSTCCGYGMPAMHGGDGMVMR